MKDVMPPIVSPHFAHLLETFLSSPNLRISGFPLRPSHLYSEEDELARQSAPGAPKFSSHRGILRERWENREDVLLMMGQMEK